MDDRFVNCGLEEIEDVCDELETAVLALKRIARYVPDEHDMIKDLYELALERCNEAWNEDEAALSRQYEEMSC